MDLAAIPSGRTPTKARLLKKFDRQPTTRKMQRSGATGKATAHDADIAAMSPFEWD
jgi:hypothetical protein